MVRRRTHPLGRDGACGGGSPRHGAVGGNQHQAALHAHLRTWQRTRRPRGRARRGHPPRAVGLSLRASGLLPDRGRGRRPGHVARAVHRRPADRRRRHRLQILDSRVRRFPRVCGDDRNPPVAAAGFVRSEGMSGYTVDPRIRWTEWIPFLVALAAFFLLPEYLSLGARILIFILFALSLDLILGYAGIVTLGHSAFFGLGAYTAGILGAKYGVADPFIQLFFSGTTAAILGLATGAIFLRTKALTLLMLTLAITSILLEIANKATGLTGGADGLSGVQVNPILGLFRFDLFGRTAFLYCLVALLIGWMVVRRLIYSPFGAMLTGIRENRARMHAIGAPVYWRMVLIYTISGTMAGIAGALLTQVNQFVGLNVLGLEPSGDLLVMLILGGVGRLYGAFVGPVIYLIAQDYLAKQYPEYWYFGIGALLITVILFAPGGILGLVDKCLQFWKPKSSARASAR